MAHPLEGTWRGSILIGVDLVEDGEFDLPEIDQNGKIKNGKHKFGGEEEDLTDGQVTADGNSFTITMTHEDFGSATKTRKYEGRVLLDLGPILTVVVGYMSKEEDGKRVFSATNQEDGTVIITRP